MHFHERRTLIQALCFSLAVHAVLLTFVAGMGHMTSGNVDFHLLGWLLCGSIPAIIVGTLISSRLPEKLIRKILGITLFALGLNFMINPIKAKPAAKPAAAYVLPGAAVSADKSVNV